MDLFAVVGIIFLVVYLAVGAYMTRRVKGIDDFYVAGRRAPVILIVGTLFASNISSVGVVIYPGIVFEKGPALILLAFSSCWGLLFLGFWLGKRLIKLKLATIPDFLGDRYQSMPVRNIASIIVLVSLVIYLTTVLLGTTIAVMGLLGWNKMACLIVAVVIIGFFTVLGGSWSVVATDTIMAFVFFFACLISVPYIVNAGGGLTSLLAAAKDKIPYAFTWTGKMSLSKAIWFYIEMNLVSLMLGMASPHLLSRVFLTENEKTLSRSMVVAAIAYPTWLLGFFFIMGLLPVLNPPIAKSSEIFPWVARNLVPPIVGALALSGIVAAALSTASTMLQQAGAALSRDIYQHWINPNASQRQLLIAARISVVIIAAVVLVGASVHALTSFAILYAFFFASSVWAGWGPALYGGILCKNATAKAALWSMVLGGTLTLVIGFLRMIKHYPLGPVPPILAGLVFSTVVFIIVNAMTKPRPEVVAYYEDMEKLAAGRGEGEN